MYVETIMSRPVDSIAADLKLSQVAHLMREKGRRFLPVVDGEARLIGLLSHREVERAAPSAITTLAVGEVNYLLGKVRVEQVMRREVISCGPRTLVEVAGQLMREKGIGCLPVVDDQRRLLGILTDDDILDFFLAITGCGLEDTSRIAVHLPDRAGELAQFLAAINAQGGYIATVVSPVAPDETGMRVVIVRFRAPDPAAIDRHLRALGIDLVSEELASHPAPPPAVQPIAAPAPDPGDQAQAEAERVGQWMLKEDRLAGLLEMELVAVSPGACQVRMAVRPEMLNAVGLTHGGATYALADFAFAVASNSHGQVAVALNTQMSYPAASRLGDSLLATAREVSRGARTGLYSIEVSTASGKLVGLFTGTVFRRGEPLADWMKPQHPG